MDKGSYKNIAVEVLRKHKRPMHYKEILEEVLKRRTTRGKTPEKTIVSVLVKNREVFIRTDSGTYTLRKT